MMKHLFTTVVLALTMCSVAFAQQSKSDETLEFRPHWSIGVQGGAGYTVGETNNFGKLISPAATLNFQWQFHHAFGLRLGLGGWQAKMATVLPEEHIYPFRFGQLNADLMMDLTSLFGGFNHKRICSTYIFAGVGGAYGYDNSAAAANRSYFSHYWEQKFFFPVRTGLGVDFRLSEVISLGLEGNVNFYSDEFNSKVGKGFSPDMHFNLLAGLKFNLGKNTRPSQAYADKVAAQEAEAAAKAAAERAAAEKAAREKAAAEKAAREKAAAEKAAAERAALAAANSKDLTFGIGSAYITKKSDAKIVELADFLKANPDFTVTVTGYADKQTGSSKVNLECSQKRAEAVAARLVKLGVSENRITTSYKGDTVQPFAENDKNRAVICTVK
ncbi:MAG: OmpA family protein [Bacteroidales bacterium]|nr:OmpA family protein [Bacteroidales bacterium]